MTDTPDARREKLARISIRERCCADCEPTEVDYSLADAILASPGIAVVQLPEADEFWSSRVDDSWLEGLVHLGATGTEVVIEAVPGECVVFDHEYARRLAAALLAAADKAENPEPTTTGAE